MGHHCEFETRIEYDKRKKQFYCCYKAKYKDKTLDVIKKYEDGSIYSRNVYFSYLVGYTVSFPGEYLYSSRSYLGKSILEKYEKDLWLDYNISPSSNFIDKNYIISLDPSIKYLVYKYKSNSCLELVRLIAIYRKNPEIEALVDLGFTYIATDKRLLKLTKKKKIQIINFLKNNCNSQDNPTLSSIFTCIKNNILYKDYPNFIYSGKDIELFNYLTKYSIDYLYYKDYIKVAKEVGHNVNNDYWKYPKDIYSFHDKVMKEKENIDNSKNAYKDNCLKEVCKLFFKYNFKINGFNIYIPSSVFDISNQARLLNQCLITGNYVDKVIKQKSILIFIKKEAVPIATAEIDYNKKVLQFYANENDRSNCKPSKDVEESLYSYLDLIKVYKRKVNLNTVLI